jgi:hypothetical protein
VGCRSGPAAPDGRNSDFANRRLHATRADALLGDAEFSRLVEEDTGTAPSAEPVAYPLVQSRRSGAGEEHRGRPAPYRYELSTAVLEHTSTVVGRDTQVNQLMAVSGEREGGYVLVEAPAGFGKTTLIADLWRRRAAGTWAGASPDLVGFSVRRDLGDHTAAAFLSSLTRQPGDNGAMASSKVPGVGKSVAAKRW